MKGSKTAEVGRSSGDRRGKKVRTYYSVGTGPVCCSEQEAREKGGEGTLVSVRAKNKVEARRVLVRIHIATTTAKRTPGQRTLRSVPGEFSFENEDDT